MKKVLKSTVSLILALMFVLCLTSCNSTDEAKLWDDAVYSEDTQLGEGAKTVILNVKVGEKTVVFTVKTDKNTVGEALFEHQLITGDNGQYGLYIKSVNGITADFDKDGAYWAFYINGEYAMTGVDGTEIEEGATYLLEYTKQ